ncbi:hypothetical protein EU527_09375 [Candidatus Thorarchaeota archaeon]|nr:MAG: hypothetical protein EU527_09375 [Candidatus Thorarchaeota archaeon]
MDYQKTNPTEFELYGWNEIRKAMEHVEKLRQNGVDARIEVIDTDCASCPAMTLCSFDELREFISIRFTHMLGRGVTTSISLDDFEQLISETTTRLFDESDRIVGKILI